MGYLIYLHLNFVEEKPKVVEEPQIKTKEPKPEPVEEKMPIVDDIPSVEEEDEITEKLEKLDIENEPEKKLTHKEKKKLKREVCIYKQIDQCIFIHV